MDVLSASPARALTPEGMVGGAVTQHFTTNQPACLVGNVFSFIS